MPHASSPAGAVLDPAGIAISSADWEQTEPAVAFDGTNYLVTWMDRRSGTNTDIYGARVSQAGAVLDPAGIAISTTASFEQQPAVAFDGINQLVAWGDGGRIYGARVSPAGAVLDPAGIEISANGDYPTVAFDGTNYLVAWAAGGYEIFGARVSPPGTVLDPGGIVISARVGSRGEESPALAFNGTNYLVAWEAYEPGDYYDSFGARVSPAGAVLDPSGIAISTAAYNQRAPSVASDGTNHLVAWQDSRTGTNWDLYGARLSQAGAVLDPAGIAISTAEGHQVEPAVAFDGTNYLVVWENFAGDHRIYGARLSQVGAVLDPAGIFISAPAAPPPPPPPPPPSPPPPPPPPSPRCKVPKVIGLKLRTARKRILARHCAVGRIRRARSRRVGRVLSQSPRAGAVKRFAYPVKLVIGRR